MKKTLLTILPLAFVSSIILSNASSAPPEGKTGSPLDGQSCTACHLGTAPSTGLDMISTDIPSDGYTPGTTYNITVTVSDASSSKFGFQLSPQNSTTKGLGTLISSGTGTTITAGKYISHAAGKTAGSNNAKSWSFEWQAPMAGTGDVTFYAAGNASNSSDNTLGDKIFIDSEAVNEKGGTTGIASFEREKVSVYPNPTSSTLFFTTSVKSAVVFDLQGKEQLRSSNVAEMQLSDLTEGRYILRLESEEGVASTHHIVKF